jgi:hypothetical protein
MGARPPRIEDIADTLRALARDHLEGRSSLERYRRLRAELLDGLVGASAGPASDITQPREAAGPDVITRPRAALRPEPTPPPLTARPRAAGASSPRPAKGSGPRIPALAALGLLLAVGVTLLVRHRLSRAVAPHPAAAAAAARSGASADPIHTLLLPLLNDEDWSDSSVRALNEALRKFPPARIAADRDRDWFNTAVETVRFRLKQQQALASAPLDPATSPIAALAQTLGIDQRSSEAAAGARKDD